MDTGELERLERLRTMSEHERYVREHLDEIERERRVQAELRRQSIEARRRDLMRYDARVWGSVLAFAALAWLIKTAIPSGWEHVSKVKPAAWGNFGMHAAIDLAFVLAIVAAVRYGRRRRTNDARSL